MKTRVFSSDDIRVIAGAVGLDRLMDETVTGLERYLRDTPPSSYQAPARDGFHYSTPAHGLLEWMPALDARGTVSIKLVGYHPSNPESLGLPTVISSALVFDTASGHLTTVMDATFATALRTGAASAVASRVLADPGSRVIGLIGCGAQSVSQLHALSRVFPVERVLIHDANPAAMDSLRKRAATFGLPDHVALEPADAAVVLSSSDIVCTQTSVRAGAGPVVADVETRPHLHINAVGSDFPGKRELPLSLLERSLVCPDVRDQAIREGECQVVPVDRIGPDMAELVRGADTYRAHRSQLTVFDSTGWGLQDHVVVGILAGYGRELGLGQDLQIERLDGDPASPYEGLAREPDVPEVSDGFGQPSAGDGSGPSSPAFPA